MSSNRDRPLRRTGAFSIFLNQNARLKAGTTGTGQKARENAIADFAGTEFRIEGLLARGLRNETPHPPFASPRAF